MAKSPLIDDLLRQARNLLGMPAPSPNAKPVMAGLPDTSEALYPNTTQSPEASFQSHGSWSHVATPMVRDAGERLYLLEYEKLILWAGNHWNSPSEMEAVCDAFRHNWRRWRKQHPQSWTGPERFFEFWERLTELRRDVALHADLQDEDNGDTGNEDFEETESVVENDTECTQYAGFVEAALLRWNDRSELTAIAHEIRHSLPAWTSALPSSLSPRRVLELIEMRLHALLQTAVPSSKPQGARPTREDRTSQFPPGCPEWPMEAEFSAATALKTEAFFHSSGMLRFMGYRVGRASSLSSTRRRSILRYVFLGRLPQVNDRLYMSEWGRPGTSRRLRKLANSLAAFARNARRKQSESWDKAIADWELDLAYLKKRYYDRRSPDWQWPETVRRKRK